MNQRQNELLKLLLMKEGGTCQIKELAEQVGCAEKTVRNDLDRLASYLREHYEASLIRKPGLGIDILISKSERVKLLNDLLSNEPKRQDERVLEMAYDVLTSEKPKTLQAWADRYYVSKAAIKSDLVTITSWLQKFHLKLVSKQRLGHVVEGAELHKRNALARLPELIPNASQSNGILDLFMPYEITLVRQALEAMQRAASLRFADGVLESLEVHTLIMIKRTRQQATVFVQESEKSAVYAYKEYDYARAFFRQLESSFRLSFPEEELVYFTWHLISSKRLDDDLTNNLHFNDDVSDTVQALIKKMSQLTLTPFEDDEILANGLALHMHSVISRIKFGFPITNPLLQQIKQMYPYMFNMVILTFEELKTTYKLDIPEHEAAYIVLHFQAAIERMAGKRDAKKKVLIVCHMGVGMSHLLEAKLAQHYDTLDVVACVGQASMWEFLKQHEVDFIISTVPIDIPLVDHIVISPLFNQQDKLALTQFIEKLKKAPEDVPDHHVIIRSTAEDLVFFNVTKDHRYQVVEMLATALCNKGYVHRDFIHSAVNREQKSATGVGGGIAIPHGDPALIHTSALAIAISKKPMAWGNEDVSLVFMLALAKENQQTHRAIIANIASLSEAPLVVHKLTAANDFNMFTSILEEHLS
ncbi:BglG family transcription antiterminator [Salipaludibacillus sp. LMS25]|uniref:BglG family transcription antiterminator n=1 Tax=Salipaludibacillus sp. LMS25 TaxID=2924031 RepID=UPI0020D1C6C7|nr:BglG family transcription antiterminator [Salipaludibacillus sp. LMS25]UTR16801.1 BglG family transcription antiterminator [Salipaludibacillus sp. LMS25]